jgi:hypothetical protein
MALLLGLVPVGVLVGVFVLPAWSMFPLHAVRPAIAIANTPARIFRTFDHSLNVLDLVQNIRGGFGFGSTGR